MAQPAEAAAHQSPGFVPYRSRMRGHSSKSRAGNWSKLSRMRSGWSYRSNSWWCATGQLVLAETAERFRWAVEYDGGGVGRLRPDVRTQDVVMDPRRAFGQPAIRNVRTESLAEDYRAGTSREDLADLYDLTAEQVDEAIRFELIAASERAA